MSNLHVLVGIPGSGKSQLAQTWWDSGFVDNIVSSDDIREEITGDPGDISQDVEVWHQFHDRIASAIRSERTVVADATHVTKKSWKFYEPYVMTEADFASGKPYLHGYFVHCYAHFVLPKHNGFWSGLEICRDRNRNRKRVVPEDVMDRMIDNWGNICNEQDLLTKNGWNLVWHRT